MSKRLKVVQPQAPVEPSRPPTAAEVLANLEQTLEYEIKHATKHLDAFSEGFAKDPSHAFGWSGDAFKAAARKRVAQDLLAWIEQTRKSGDEYEARSDAEVLRIVHQELRAEVLRNAKWPEHSTSPTSNYMSQCLVSLRAKNLERIENYLARMARGS